MIVYNLFPPLVGPFGAWVPHMERAASMGFDWLFVNPVQLPGRSGSIYSVADHFRINPMLVDPAGPGSAEDQARTAAEHAHRLGLRSMVDLVINHCAADADLVGRHPEWFRHEPDGSISHPSCVDGNDRVVWEDLAQFDHDTPDAAGLERYFVDVAGYLLSLGFDGFRCDAAYQVPQSLWRRLVGEMKARRPDLVFVAETLGCSPEQTRSTAAGGFDWIFNSVKWWDFQSPWLMEQYQLMREIAPSIGFPESHDTLRLAREVDGNVEALKQRYLLAALFSAGCMMPIGYEFGFRRDMHVVHTRPTDWEATGVDLCGYIGAVNALKRNHAVFGEEGPTAVLSSPGDAVLVLWKASTTASQEALVFLNTDAWNHQEVLVDDLRAMLSTERRLIDVSPDGHMDYISVSPFHYGLRPGQGVVLVTG
ncbi:MAG TPA: alpha-amylase family glycosyl hydrolase [Acidimicrobiales bacterium]|nr:alpha-amylase family glycosyl hydrolase [Acidimicrobiales bacterium]